MTVIKTVTESIELSVVNCGECGGIYSINERYRQQKRENGGYWTCPYCKVSWGYGTSEKDKSENENKNLRKRLEWAEQAQAQQRAAQLEVQHQLRAQKAAKTRLKNRINGGVCPCCNRSFKGLAEHMRKQHPEFIQED